MTLPTYPLLFESASTLWHRSFLFPICALLFLCGITRLSAQDDAISRHLAQLRESFVTACQTEVGQSHDAALKELDGKYLAALDRALAAAMQGSDLDGALALRKEKERVSAGGPLPPDDAGIPASLHALRQTYREAISGLAAQRVEKIAPLRARYSEVLEAYQIQLTQAGNLDGALAVKAVRDGLDKEFALVAASPADGTIPTSSSSASDGNFENSLGMKFVPVPGTQVLFCVHETRRSDYAAYAKDVAGIDSSWTTLTANGYTVRERTEEHPVWRVSWEDAKGFCEWLSRKEGKVYRLPTDEEWSIAVGLGRKERRSRGDTPESLHGQLEKVYPWGTEWPPPEGAGNYRDESYKIEASSARTEGAAYLEGYNDGFPTIAPVMSFPANEFGIHDLGGNLREWVEDWFNEAKTERALRGISWDFGADFSLLSSYRSSGEPTKARLINYGFRVVLELP